MDTKEILLESLEKFCTNTSGKCKNSFLKIGLQKMVKRTTLFLNRTYLSQIFSSGN